MISIAETGIDAVSRSIDRVDRAITKERQANIRAAARMFLVPPMKARARSSPGKAGALLAKAVTARNGKAGAVLVGPRGGKRGAWFRHFFIGGAKAHQIGGAQSAGTRTFRSSSRQYAAAGGIFARSHKGRERKFLYNAAGAFIATGPVRHPGFADNPFVEVGTEAGQAAFIAEVRKRFFVGPMNSGPLHPETRTI